MEELSTFLEHNGYPFYLLAVGTVPWCIWGIWWLARNNAKHARWVSVGAVSPRTTVARATAGQAHLEGSASAAGETVQSPLYGAHCLAFSFEVFSHHHTEGIGWRTSVYRETKAVPFWLTDQTGSILIRAAGEPELELLDEPSQTVSPSHAPHDYRIARLRELGVSGIPQEYVFVERRLDPGEPCGVYGQVRPAVDGVASVSEGKHGLLITDARTSDLMARMTRSRRLAIGGVISCVSIWVLIIGVGAVLTIGEIVGNLLD